MKVVSSSKSFYLLRLSSGEELRETIRKFCAEKNINAAWLNALGSSKDVELAYYHLEKKEYQARRFEENLEITAITGNVAVKDGNSFVHAHGTFSRASMGMLGGHINRCVVSATCEVGIWVLEGNAGREYDEVTGLHLLCPAD